MKLNKLLLLICLVYWFIHCSTEPEINWDKLDDNYFVNSSLVFTDTSAIGEISDTDMQVSISRLRYLIDYAFSSDEDQTFGISNARVTITGNGRDYSFIDIGHGIYKYTVKDSTDTIRRDMDYSLQIIMPDGEIFTSQLHTPLITIEPKDTIWIYPDSILTWSIPEQYWYPKTPLSVSNTVAFKDTIQYHVQENKDLKGSGPAPAYYETSRNYNIQTNHLWVKFDTTGSSLIISTASDSPSVFLEEFNKDSIQLSFGCSHKYSGYISEIFNNIEEYGILDNLVDYSNISGKGAYGIFTSQPDRISKKFIIKVKSRL
ncbi:MAG: hypothetical protein PHW79_01270 [Candidatus Marinimicrobia bacterium]|nr:hypothetical protein [Candidatus Neomarinimicrobiota bacterium]